MFKLKLCQCRLRLDSSDCSFFGAKIYLEVIRVKSHKSLKRRQVLVFLFWPVSDCELGIFFLLLMFLWVPPHVNSLFVGEEKAVEVSLELSKGECLNHSNLFLLSIELVTVADNFSDIETVVLFLHVLILFSNVCEHRFADSVEACLIHCFNFLSLFSKHSVYAIAKMGAALFLRLYHDPEA